jgi:hypothetical protein
MARYRFLGLPDIDRLAKYRIDHLPHGIASCRELIAVTVVPIDRDPIVRDSPVDPALEIAVTYIEKIIALKRAARRYPMAHENVKDLAADIFIGGPVKHGSPMFERRAR